MGWPCTFTVGKLLFRQLEEGWACCTSNIVQTLVFYSQLPGLNRHWLDLVHPLSVNYFFHSRNKVGPIVSQHCTNVGNQQSIFYIGPTFNRSSQSSQVQCETAHYRDAKTTSCLPKISFETVLSDPLEMPIVSARSLIVNREFLWTNSLIWLTCCSSVDVDGRPGRSKSSKRSLPSLKSFYHL